MHSPRPRQSSLGPSRIPVSTFTTQRKKASNHCRIYCSCQGWTPGLADLIENLSSGLLRDMQKEWQIERVTHPIARWASRIALQWPALVLPYAAQRGDTGDLHWTSHFDTVKTYEKKAHPINEGGPPEAWRIWASQAVRLAPALGVPGIQLCCCHSKEAEMNLSLVSSLLYLIYQVYIAER